MYEYSTTLRLYLDCFHYKNTLLIIDANLNINTYIQSVSNIFTNCNIPTKN